MINYCLLLGFEGRYRVLDNGRTQLENTSSSAAVADDPRRRQLSGAALSGRSPEAGASSGGRWFLSACVALAGFIARLFIVLNWRSLATAPNSWCWL